MAVKKVKKSNPLAPWQDLSADPYIHIDNISKEYDGVPAISELSLDIYKGEFFSLLGPSGCGKSTLLRILAGLESPSEGRILIDGKDITRIPPYERPVNMMFQSYALFPHMTVEQNVAFGLKQEGIKGQELNDRVEKSLLLVHMENFAKRKPHQLSGGQRQRVALARSLIKRPKLVLLDEPLGALDKQLREKTQFELVNIQEEVGVTFIMVTHDQEEAMTMSSRIAVMEHGRIRQVGTPNEIYEYPNSHYVAGFVGTMNIFDAIIEGETPKYTILACEELESSLKIAHAAVAPEGSAVGVAIRPEKIMMSVEEPNQEYNCVQGKVMEIAYLGDVSTYYIKAASGKLIHVTIPNQVRLVERAITWEDNVYLYWRPESGVILTS